jgi:hypothetical protein
MRVIVCAAILAPLLVSGSVVAAESTSEPIQCYEKAWASRETGGLGLTAGQAVTLCSGTFDANKTIQCYAKAWTHPANGGLGLNAGQAILLCKTNSLQ